MATQILFPFISSAVLCFFAIPSIIRICEAKKLCDTPCSRKNHAGSVPSLGGVGIFIGFIFAVCFWANQTDIVELQFIICSLLLLFFTGLKDDIVNLTAIKKLFMQIVCAFIIVHYGEIYLTSFYGIMGIYNIPYYISLPFSMFVIIAITNAFNLIDGIDTLAGSIGALALICFGAWFYITGHTQYSILSFSMLGSLASFIHYNKTPARVFMGDTGSLVIGFIISILAIKFIEFNRLYYGNPIYRIQSVPAVTIAVLIIPIFDTLRVFIIRVLNKKSPLRPDRNHLHHILADKNVSHIKATGILLSVNIAIIALAFMLRDTVQAELIVAICVLIMCGFTFIIKNKAVSRKIVQNTQHLVSKFFS